jgi:hypothetical protein
MDAAEWLTSYIEPDPEFPLAGCRCDDEHELERWRMSGDGYRVRGFGTDVEIGEAPDSWLI